MRVCVCVCVSDGTDYIYVCECVCDFSCCQNTIKQFLIVCKLELGRMGMLQRVHCGKHEKWEAW